jgi:3-dehydroquinate dehydratase I
MSARNETPLIAGVLSAPVLESTEAAPDGEVAGNVRLCDVLEIRYDLFPDRDSWPDLARRAKTVHPSAILLGTIRLERDGGALPDSFGGRRMPFWEKIIDADERPDWLDLERFALADYASLRPRCACAGMKIIVSEHDFKGIPGIEELSASADECARLKADGFKIAAMSSSAGDCACLYAFIERRFKDFEWLSVFAMGDTGRASRLWSLACGANLTYASITEAAAPGQIPVARMKSLLKNLPDFHSEADFRAVLNKNV